MANWCGKFVFLLALVVMPLQGIAATASALFCQMNGAEGGHHVMHAHDVHDHEANHDSPGAHDHEGGTGSHAVGDLCSHHFASALPAAILSGATPGFQVLTLAPHRLPDLFIPDRPQRPPLA